MHFACTSEDINNTSHALMLQAARDTVLLPALDRLLAKLRADGARAGRRADAQPHPRPDRQPHHAWARRWPTSAARLATARARIAAVPLLAKMNGAVGNYNAHLAAYPGFDWEAFSAPRRRAAAWAWRFNPYTIQIEPHDYMAELFDADGARQHHPHRLVRATSGATSRWATSSSALKAGEVGSQHHAAQGQPDRLRERRGQLRPGQCAARAPERRSCRSAAGSAT
ncbi:MAG: lyase family protein [Comamonadaceae bacterium]|nr:lyase family protein [Comamonadaceae bacterium]